MASSRMSSLRFLSSGTGSPGSNSPLVTSSTGLWRLQRDGRKWITWRPAVSAGHVVGPALAEVGDERSAIHTAFVSEAMAGDADLAAAGLEQYALIAIGPTLDGMVQGRTGRLKGRERGAHHARHTEGSRSSGCLVP
jgi:hypothetical protein